MQFKVTPTDGRVVQYDLTVNGETTIVINDPANEARPGVDLKTWVADAGGTKPIEEPPCPPTSNGRDFKR